MKSLRTLILAGTACAFALTATAAMKVGLLTKDRNLFWTAVEEGANAAAKTAGVDLIVRAPTAANNVGQQLKLLASLEKESLDVLIIGPLVQEEFKAPIAALAAKGVKIVTVDTPLAEGTAQCHIGYDQKDIAENAAKLFAGLVANGDELAILRANSVEGVSIREKTLANALKTLLPKSTLHLDVKAGLEKDDDYGQAEHLFAQYPGTHGVITPFSSSSIAMIKLLKDKGLAGKVVHVGIGTGFPKEAEEAMAGGDLQGWIAQQPKLLGSRAVEIAVVLASGKPVPATVNVEFLAITKDRMNDPKIQAMH